MSAEVVVRTMIHKRLADKMSEADAYDSVISILNEDLKEVTKQGDELADKLKKANHTEEYIKERMKAFQVQVNWVVDLISVAEHFKRFQLK